MKIAITSSGNQPESTIDSRFGRCSYFAVYNTESKETQFLENPAKEASGGAGPAAVQFIAGQKVNKVISVDFGTKIKPLMDNLHIEMQIEKDQNKTIRAIIDAL